MMSAVVADMMPEVVADMVFRWDCKRRDHNFHYCPATRTDTQANHRRTCRRAPRMGYFHMCRPAEGMRCTAGCRLQPLGMGFVGSWLWVKVTVLRPMRSPPLHAGHVREPF